MNTIHKQLKIEHRRRRLENRISEAQARLDRYTANKEPELITRTSAEVRELYAKLDRHLRALRA